MPDEFIKFQEYLKRLKDIYYSALSSFYVFEAIEEFRAPNMVGEKTKTNLETIKRFNNFFVTIRYATNFHFFMELAKLFDDAKQSLHLDKLINFVESNNQKLSVENFKNANQGRKFLENLIQGYEGITENDLIEIKNLLNKNHDIVQKLTDYRDQNLAHEDKNKKKIIITVEEIYILFKIIKKILNTFSYKTDFSETKYDHVETDCKNDTKRVIEYLGRFEKYRLQEIEEMFKKDWEQQE